MRNIIKEINSINLKDRLLPGYKLDNTIFRIAIALIVPWLLIAASRVGWTIDNQVYFECGVESLTACPNPYYLQSPCKDYSLCFKETFYPGESYGTKPDFFYKFASTFAFAMMALAVLVNHLIYNRGYRRSDHVRD